MQRLVALAALLLLPLAAAHDVPPAPPIVVPEGEVLEVTSPCITPAELHSDASIVVQGTVVAVQKGCSGSEADRASKGATLRLWAPLVVLDGGTLIAGDGDNGTDRTTLSGAAYGQSGGHGGDVVIDAEAYELNGTIVLGSGGDGGDLDVNFGQSVSAVGGHGGHGGTLLVSGEGNGTGVVFEGGHGGHGGDIDVRASTIGPPGRAGTDLTGTGGHGGNGSALSPGARGGDGGDAVVSAGHGKPGGNTTVDGGDGGNATATGGRGGSPDGRGGDATAVAGRGGDGLGVIQPPCTVPLHAAGDGGRGGDATAYGGLPAGARGDTTADIEASGNASVRSGSGGRGGDNTTVGGIAGDGGDAGTPVAIGGMTDRLWGEGGPGGTGRAAGGVGGHGMTQAANGTTLGDIPCQEGAPTDPYHVAEPKTPGKRSPALAWPLTVVALAWLARR